MSGYWLNVELTQFLELIATSLVAPEYGYLSRSSAVVVLIGPGPCSVKSGFS